MNPAIRRPKSNWLFRHAWLNPRPADRIDGILRRISRERRLDAREALDIAEVLACRFSGNPGATMRAFDYLLYGLHTRGRFLRGQYRHDWLTDYEKLKREALENGWQFVDIADYRAKQQIKNYRRQMDADDTRRFINKIRKELNGLINQQLRQAA